MKTFFTLLLVGITSSIIFAQELPVINAGTGLTAILNTQSSVARTNSVSGYNFVIEKPLEIPAKKINFLSVHPGIDYTILNESFESSGLGRYYQYEVTASATSIYSKILFNTRLKLQNSFTIYTGANLGVYFWSQIDGKGSSSKSNYENGKSLFRSGFWGLLFGIRPKLPDDSKFAPSLEISYCPNYIDLNIGKRNAINISFLFGFYIKKATHSE